MKKNISLMLLFFTLNTGFASAATKSTSVPKIHASTVSQKRVFFETKKHGKTSVILPHLLAIKMNNLLCDEQFSPFKSKFIHLFLDIMFVQKEQLISEMRGLNAELQHAYERTREKEVELKLAWEEHDRLAKALANQAQANEELKAAILRYETAAANIQ